MVTNVAGISVDWRGWRGAPLKQPNLAVTVALDRQEFGSRLDKTLERSAKAIEAPKLIALPSADFSS